YQELARTLKARMREEGDAIALSPALRKAGRQKDHDPLARELKKQLRQQSGLVSLKVTLPDGQALGSADRGRPLDPEHENQLEVARPLGNETADATGDDDVPQLEAVFAADKAR